MPRSATFGLDALEPRVLLSTLDGSGVTDVQGPLPPADYQAPAAYAVLAPLSAQITDSTLPPVAETGGGVGTITVSIRNTQLSRFDGGRTVDLSLYLRPYGAADDAQDIPVGARGGLSVGYLQPGQARPFTARARVPVDIAQGRYSLVVVVDTDQVTLKAGQRVSAVYDQTVRIGSNVEVAGQVTGQTLPGVIGPGESPSGYVYTTLTNIGSEATAGGSTVDLRVVARPVDAGDSAAQDVVLGERVDQLFGYIDPHESKTFSVRVKAPADLPRGRYRVLTLADASDAVGVPGSIVTAGSDAHLDVGQAVALTGRTLGQTLPLTVEAGQTAGGALTIELTNTGFAQIPGGASVNLTTVVRPVSAGADASQDVVVGTRVNQKVGYLDPGASKELGVWVRLPAGLSAGQYRLLTMVTPVSPAASSPGATGEVAASAPLPSASTDILVDGPTVSVGDVAPPDLVETDAKAIARWDVVPFQTIEDRFGVGVVAFHINGIDRVEFTVNGGEPIVISRMSLNPHSGVEEYWFELDPADYPDGELVVDATVYPEYGTPRVLSGAFGADPDNGEYSLVLFANAGGSHAPQQITIGPGDSLADALLTVADGGEVLLRPGTYNLTEMLGASRPFERWVTIRPADGVEREQVLISLDERRDMGIRGSKIHWQNITFDFATIRRIYPRTGDLHWFDSVHWYDSNGWTPGYERYFRPMHNMGTGFITDSRIEDMIYGAAGMEMVRNIELHRISGDAFQQSELIVNSTVTNVEATLLSHHTDVFQYWAPQDTRLLENRIVYNVHGEDINSQHFFMRTGGGGTFRDFAFVNIDLHMKDTITARDRASQLHTSHEHVLFVNVFSEHRLLLRGEGDAHAGEEYAPTDVLFRDSSFNAQTIDQFTLWNEVLAHDNTVID